MRLNKTARTIKEARAKAIVHFFHINQHECRLRYERCTAQCGCGETQGAMFEPTITLNNSTTLTGAWHIYRVKRSNFYQNGI